jgi:hypothetical protein
VEEAIACCDGAASGTVEVTNEGKTAGEYSCFQSVNAIAIRTWLDMLTGSLKTMGKSNLGRSTYRYSLSDLADSACFFFESFFPISEKNRGN